MTPADYTRLQQRISSRAPVATSKPARGNKYGAMATTVDGQRFDSKAEAKRFLQLKALQQAGEISELDMQVRIPLLPAQSLNGRKERPVEYVCDFVYVKDGKKIYEDVKSAPTKTREFVLKRKMALFFHGIVVVELMVS